MSVRDLDVAVLRDAVARLLVESNYNIPPDILDALRGAIAREKSPLGRRTLVIAVITLIGIVVAKIRS